MKISVALLFVLCNLCVQSKPYDWFDKVGEAFDSFGDAVEEVFEPVGEAFDSFGNAVEEVFEPVGEAFESAGEAVEDAIEDLFGDDDSPLNPNCKCPTCSICYDVVITNDTNGFGNDQGIIATHPHIPPLADPQNPVNNPAQRPGEHVPSQMTPHTPVKNPSMQPEPTRPSQIPSNNSTINPSPQSQTPSQPQTPTLNPSPQPHTPKPPLISPSSDSNCTCTPFFGCYDEETSSNLTTIVDDRTQESCPNPNDVCCYNLVKPFVTPTNNQSSESQPLDPHQMSPKNSTHIKPMIIPDFNQSSEPQPISPPQISPNNSTISPSPLPQPQNTPLVSPTNVNCTCTPFFRCYDDETSSNLTGTVDDRTPTTVIQESCSNPNDVCCYNLVQPPNSNLSAQPQPNGTPLTSTRNSALNLSPKPQHHDPSLTSTQNSTMTQISPAQPPIPSQISPQNANCACIPLSLCSDDETSSYPPEAANDGSHFTGGQLKICPEPTEICCLNLAQPPLTQTRNPTLPLEHQDPSVYPTKG